MYHNSELITIIVISYLVIWIICLILRSRPRALGVRLRHIVKILDCIEYKKVDFEVIQWKVEEESISALIRNELEVKMFTFDCTDPNIIKIKVYSDDGKNLLSEVDSKPDEVYDWIKFHSTTKLG